MDRQEGLTLIEIVLSLVVLSVLAIFFFGYIYSYTKTYKTMASQRELHEEATYVMERITRELRDARLTMISEPNFLPNQYVVESNALVFERAHPTPKDGNRYIAFFFLNNRILRSSFESFQLPPYVTGKTVGNNVKSFLARYVAGSTGIQDDSFQIDLEVEKNGLSIRLTTIVSPKNTVQPPYFRGRHFNGDYEDVIN